MRVPQRNLSMLWHDLDRAAFLAYFLGAIVPLVVLGGVIEQNVIRKHIKEKEEEEAKGLVPTTKKAGGKIKKKKPKPFFKT